MNINQSSPESSPESSPGTWNRHLAGQISSRWWFQTCSFKFSSLNLGKWSNSTLTSIFFRWVVKLLMATRNLAITSWGWYVYAHSLRSVSTIPGGVFFFLAGFLKHPPEKMDPVSNISSPNKSTPVLKPGGLTNKKRLVCPKKSIPDQVLPLVPKRWETTTPEGGENTRHETTAQEDRVGFKVQKTMQKDALWMYQVIQSDLLIPWLEVTNNL